MLSQINVVEIEHALSVTPAAPSFPPSSDRDAWQQTELRMGADAIAAMIALAEEDAAAPILALPATLFLQAKRSGERAGYEGAQGRRREMLINLALAECLEDRGRFLDPILDVAWAICEESSWVMPAHQIELTDIHRPEVDLGVAMTALELAELDALLGNRLDPLLGKRIRDEVDRRCLVPYLTRHDFRWLHRTQDRNVSNWTAVCNGGLVGAALYLERDPVRLAAIVAKAARSLDDYLDTFDEDGGSSEGPGYWDYGFGYYTMLAHLIAHRTGGRVDFLSGDHLLRIASFPLRTLLSPGMPANFSDCDADITYTRPLLAHLAKVLDLPALVALAQEQPIRRHVNLSWRLRDLFWPLPEEIPGPVTTDRHDWFRGLQWMFARFDPSDTNGLVVVAKGGHNDEMHNQNDVGAFIVHVNRESLIADIGRGRYTVAYFGPERYDHLPNSSLGHSVPVANGVLQREGREHRAQLLAHEAGDQEDTLLLEMKDAYPAQAQLASLQRRITLHRAAPKGWVEVKDRVRFAQNPGTFESAITTFADVILGDTAVILRGTRGKLRVGFDPDTVEVRLDLFDDVDLAHGPTTVRRVVFSFLEPVKEGTVRLQIEPVA